MTYCRCGLARLASICLGLGSGFLGRSLLGGSSLLCRCRLARALSLCRLLFGLWFLGLLRGLAGAGLLELDWAGLACAWSALFVYNVERGLSTELEAQTRQSTRLSAVPIQCDSATDGWRPTLWEFEGLAVTSLEGATDVLVERGLSQGAEVVVGHDVFLDSLATVGQSVCVNKLNADDEEKDEY